MPPGRGYASVKKNAKKKFPKPKAKGRRKKK